MAELEKAHIYSIAIGSASECASVYEILLIAKVVNTTEFHAATQKLSEVCAMLVAMRKTMMRKSGVKKLVKKINR
jgi:four helix bundle protein